MFYYLVFGVAFAFVGCITASDKAQNLHYTKDRRTDLCFAMYCVGCKTSAPITNVPCTPEVERLLETE